MKILINGPSEALKNKGGVANHIHGLKKYWTEKFIYNAVGNRGSKQGSGKYWLPWDIIKFTLRLVFQRPDFVWINPSITKNALRRDFVFLKIAHLLNIKVAVFIHGFDLTNFGKMDPKWLASNLNKAAFIMVLAKDFKSQLQKIGVDKPIELTTTKVEDSLLDDFNIESKRYNSRKLLFLARVENAKGIYETIDTYAILKNEFKDLSLQISGGGSEVEPAKKYVKEKNITDVEFTGFIGPDQIKEAYKTSLLLLLLTSHGEGLPTSVLEAMAFGLPVVTRPVGGLADFFENGVMGFISESLEPKDFAEGIRPLLLDASLAERVGKYNYDYAKSHFYASSVAKQLESYFRKYNT